MKGVKYFMKKTITILAILMLLTFSLSIGASTPSDVPSDHWAYDAINNLIASGIIEGYSDGQFKGRDSMNRYEMAVIVNRVLKEITDEIDKNNQNLSKSEAEDVKVIVKEILNKRNSDDNNISDADVEEVKNIINSLTVEFESELEEIGSDIYVLKESDAKQNTRLDTVEEKQSRWEGFEWHGYARSGYVMNTNGGSTDQKLPSDFRLGNEMDTYFEQTVSNKMTTNSGAWMKGQFTFAHSNNLDGTYGIWEDKMAVREAFVEGGGFDFAPEANFWAGGRFYGRNDIHITDFYWRDMSGYGAGAKGIKFSNFSMDLAFIGESEGTVFENVGEKSQQNIDIRLKDIEGLGGYWEFELTPSWSNGDENEVTTKDRTGIQAAAVYNRSDFYGFTDGNMTAALQYGDDLGSNVGSSYGLNNNEEQSSVRLLTYGLTSINKNWDVMPQFVYQFDQDYDGKNDRTDITAGVRFVNYLTDNFAMQYEIGHDYTDNDKGDYKVTKLTIAPTIKLESNFWSRPELRFFVTHAFGDEYKDDAKTEPVFADEFNEDSGTVYGVQFESWW